MPPIRRIVLDVLKPHEPSILEIGEEVASVDGVSGSNAILMEIDKEVENVKITVVGDDIEYEKVQQTIQDLGGSVHSIDEIVCGEDLVEESKTPQD